MTRIYLIIVSTILLSFPALSQKAKSLKILPGAYQTNEYFKLLKGKKVAVFANHTSYINKTHLIDTLQKSGISVVKIFAPEHGFRGNANAGESINNSVDSATGISIISLYGKHSKPTTIDLKNVDIIVFDIQDVGVRFYTYISSMEELMEAAIDNNKPLIVLDRPNPNGFYVDGPILDSAYKSFVGKQCIPIVYGMTIGEYAKMLLGEKLLSWQYIRKVDEQIHLGQLLGFEDKKENFSLTVIPCKNYTHASRYVLPIPPSPNLPDMASVYWYPSTCLFEGTVISEGRGTEHPFCIVGHPNLKGAPYSFTPVSKAGATVPKFMNVECKGWNLWQNFSDKTTPLPGFQLTYLLKAYQMIEDKASFFTATHESYFFNKLAGSDQLMKQIIAGKTETEIRQGWQKGLETFKKIRKKYLLYAESL